MDFKIDMSKVVKIVVQKDDKSFIEYTIDNGTIVDVSISEKETTLEEKVKNLKENNEQVKTISKLIQFDNAGVFDKMAQNGSNSVFDTIKEDVVNNPIQESVVKEINEVSDSINKDKLTQGVKDAANIMKLDEQMNEVAKENREKIAEKLFTDIPSDYSRDIALKNGLDQANGLDEALKISDRNERISYFKDMISKINTKEE